MIPLRSRRDVRRRVPRCLLSSWCGLGLAGALLAGGPAAQGFGPEQGVASGQSFVNAVCPADLDGDGDPDVLWTSYQEDRVGWSENLGGGFGPEQPITTTADGAYTVHAADLDGDGDRDVVWGANAGDTIAWQANTDGLGGFGAEQPITTTADGVWELAAADLDGDGDEDVVAALEDGGTVSWYANTNGAGSFGTAQTVALSAADAVFAVDLDGDGDLDVAFGSYYDDEVGWAENLDGLGASWQVHAVGGTDNDTSGVEDVAAGDLDGDGDPELLAAAADNDSISWYENQDGLGTFGTAQYVDVDAYGASSVQAVDFDRDGDLDVLSSNFAFNLPGDMYEITWYANQTGVGDFPSQELVSFSAAVPQEARASDLDGDGYPDIVAAISSNVLGAGRVIWFENLHEPLMADLQTISLAAGGTQALSLTGGPEHAAGLYFVLGSATGTVPGIPTDNGLTLPLNLDNYLLFTALNPNTALLSDSLGFLDANGLGAAAFQLPPGLAPSLAGVTLHHAYAVLDFLSGPIETVFVSNPVPIALVP